MRINTVKHARKPQKCGRCGTEIKPSRDEVQDGKKVRVLGDSYRWIQFNSFKGGGGRHVRCASYDCRFRQSDLTNSKMSGVYAAQETAEEAIDAWDGETSDDLQAILSECAEAAREVAEEYRESAANMESAFPGGSPTIDECNEKADEIDSWADELESVDFDDKPEDDEDEDANEDEDGDKDEEKKRKREEALEEWREGCREAAREAVGALSL